MIPINEPYSDGECGTSSPRRVPVGWVRGGQSPHVTEPGWFSNPFRVAASQVPVGCSAPREHTQLVPLG